MATRAGGEQCDWCGRPGVVRQHDYWRNGILVCRDPVLCDVCELCRDLPGDVHDAMDEAGLDYEAVRTRIETELERKWQEKVARGERAPADGEPPPAVAYERP
jgi:hypothetical protein